MLTSCYYVVVESDYIIAVTAVTSRLLKETLTLSLEGKC